MLTVIETFLFQKAWPNYWTDGEYQEFVEFVAKNPLAGDVIPHSGGVRKVRWKRSGVGKSSGVRVIYFIRNELEEVVLLTIYAKSKLANLDALVLKELRHEFEKRTTQ